jgi:Fe2+ or Zn2+ uptake regulation protein
MYGQLRNESAILIIEKSGNLNGLKQDRIIATNPGQNTRELLVSMLAEIPGLTCQQVHRLIQKMKVNSITVQATYKTLQQLSQQKVVSKTSRKYYLNLDWVKQTKIFYQALEERIQQTKNKEIIMQ